MICRRLRWLATATVLVTLAAVPAVAQSDRQHRHHTGKEMPKASTPAPTQPLKILMPADGATVGTRLAIVFQTSADLSRMTMGAPTPGTHLHIEAQDVSMMPSQEQLIRLGEDRYLFVFDEPAKPGKNTLRVFWADAQHHTIPDSVQQVAVTVARDAAQ